MEIRSDPVQWLAEWLEEAKVAEPRVPDAMQLATVDHEGRPWVRTVLLKSLGSEGLIFYTNYGSRKAKQLDVCPVAALCLHWKSLERQVLVNGTVTRLSAERSDAYFATRPRGSQLGAWASRQSEPLTCPEVLAQRMASLDARSAGQPVPRPAFWGGYLLAPDRFEFWQGREDRLHDRVAFTRDTDQWIHQRLYP